ncbi:hypothetical protein F4677DRAFT_461874 [Hypoxylon crocopeplum]|nr:hypothetical protein F4677DRAFT_461874 [Hypoxylon crocopeplum]
MASFKSELLSDSVESTFAMSSDNMSSHASQLQGGLVPQPLPEEFKCTIDGEWCSASMFSNKQLAKWHKTKKCENDGVTPENIELVCKSHTGQPGQREIQCTGPCAAWKYPEHFSKTQRNRTEPWCIKCTSWRLFFGGDEAPPPPPNSNLDEIETYREDFLVRSGAKESEPTPQQDQKAEEEDEGDLIDLNVPALADPSWMIQEQLRQEQLRQEEGVAMSQIMALDDEFMGGDDQDSSIDTSVINAFSNRKPTEKDAGLYGSTLKDSTVSKITPGSEAETRVPATTDSKPWGPPSEKPASKWFKGDTRRVFDTPPDYALRPEDCTTTEHSDSASSDEDV